MKTAVQARWPVLLVFVSILSLLVPVDATAQGDSWSFILTPQIWGTHVAKNGFSTASTFSQFFVPDAGGSLTSAGDSHQTHYFDPQVGIQFAAQKGRWTLAGSFQYVNFETQSDVIFTPPAGNSFAVQCSPNFPSERDCLHRGERVATEFLDTNRFDLDLAASYFFPDVVPGWLDFSIGGGVKAIYAEATRKFRRLSVLAAEISAIPPPGLYLICRKDNCLQTHETDFTDRVKTKTWEYGVTVPMNTTLHLSRDGKWLLPLNVSPFLGAETRDDRDVVFKFNDNGTVRRLDGTTFAYGATADASVRWLLTDTLSFYSGFRVQYIKGHEQYLAYGPLFGMSYRFGGK